MDDLDLIDILNRPPDQLTDDQHLIKDNLMMRISSNVEKAEDWAPLFDKLSCVGASGGLKFVTDLDAMYSKPVFAYSCNSLLGFHIFARNDEDCGKDKDFPASARQVGLEMTCSTGNNHQAVEAAFDGAAERYFKDHPWMTVSDMETRVPFKKIMEALYVIAKHCDLANKHVELYMDYGR